MKNRSLLFLPLLCLTVAVAVAPAQAEVTKTLHQELAAGGSFGVENLAGTMKIVSGSGRSVVVTATVHAESNEVADQMRIEQVSGKDGAPTLRVIYPTSQYGTVRYPGSKESSFLSRMFSSSNTTTHYAGKRVKVSTDEGTLMYADLEVQVPSGSEGALRNIVGDLMADGVEGTLSFETGSGNVTLNALKGKMSASTGSGDVQADTIDGSFEGDTGSGNVTLTNFHGDKVDCKTG